MNPEISIVTVVKNDSLGLQATLSSLFSQLISNWECLIISAESKDDTRMIADLKASLDPRVIHLHEDYPGIYQAMNQGASKAKAPYLIFMNAGDIFSFNRATEVLLQNIVLEKCPVVVGGYASAGETYSFKSKKFGPRAFSINRRWGCHQSMILDRRMVLNHGGFSLDFKIASDFDLVLKMVKHAKGKRIDEVISIIDPNGVSSTGIRTVLKEKQEIRNQIFGKFSLESVEGKIWTFLVIARITLRNLLSKPK
jgi:glycosyltransferase involved in cell wall biosynthesis